MSEFAGARSPGQPEVTGRVSLDSLLALLQKIPVLCWTTDLEARFSWLTGPSLRSLGISAEECDGKPVDFLFPSADPGSKALQAHALAVAGHGGAFFTAVRGRELEAHVEPLRDAAGRVTGTVGVAVDGAERAVTDLALRLSEQSYRLLIEEAPYAICRATASGQLLQANRAMMEILGYDPGSEADLLERDLPLIFASPVLFEVLRCRLMNGDTVQGLESIWRGRGGNEIQVRVGGRGVREPGGKLLYLDILAENITERKQLEARLAQAQKMHAIGQLAGGVAHDFNNLLTVIGGQIEMVLARPLDAELRERLEDVRHASDRAAALTRQLLAFSRRQVLQLKVLDINQLIERLSLMLARLIRENIELVFVPGCDLGMVQADPNQIEQVLMNLAVNAQDAMPAGGKLTIETANVKIEAGPSGDGEGAAPSGPPEPGEYVLIAVHDTGEGMDPDTQARIFEPFFTTKKTGEGTGLGLAMAYGVVEQSGGHIQVESHAGHGSTFRVYLPRTAAAAHEGPPQPPTSMVSPTGRETILLAEDERWVRKLVTAHLEDLGYRVLAACDGADALELAHAYAGGIDLLLSDLVMPRVDGRELALQLRQEDPQLKVIFVSGYAGHGVTGKDLEVSGACFLSKPVSMQLLAQTVREVLDGVVR